MLAFLVPGSAQLRAGRRLIGGIAVAVWLLLWLALLVIVVVFVASPATGFGLAANSSWLSVASAVALVLAALWFVLGGFTVQLLVRRRRMTGAALGRRIAVVAATVVATLVSGGIPLAAAGALHTVAQTETRLFVGSPDVTLSDGRLNILLLGTDAGPDREGRRTDSISVVSVDAATGRVVLVGLPRELQQVPLPEDSPLRADYPSGVYDCGNDCQLGFLFQRTEQFTPEEFPDALAQHSSPGVEAVRDAAEGALGMVIPYYLQVDMLGFSALIDEVGGVELDVSERLPIDGDENGVGVAGYIEPGTQRMNGTTALWYARSRQSTSDFDRMSRQRELEQALLEQKSPLSLGLAFARVTERDPGVVGTDLTEGALGRLLALASAARDQPVTTLELTPPAVDPQNPDYAAVRGMVAAALG
ncbi:hypothetical protein B7R54_08490 [Subtercola boreus]|uniref:Cell envelope-related transcriptional attenuator domain-containing protein n=1 Tax=Subtercola boreus TaxID=120213 RepID=A0A3E0VIP1_9MICO|nr:hypothetical protein B7R54_08490 [Subtercola boreus]